MFASADSIEPTSVWNMGRPHGYNLTQSNTGELKQRLTWSHSQLSNMGLEAGWSAWLCQDIWRRVPVVPHLGEVCKGTHGTGFREHIYLSGAHAVYVKPQMLWILQSNTNGYANVTRKRIIFNNDDITYFDSDWTLLLVCFPPLSTKPSTLLYKLIRPKFN